jgi:WD40 repeat protein
MASTPDSRYLLVDDECGRGSIWDLRSRRLTGRFSIPSSDISYASGLAPDRFGVADTQGNTYIIDSHGRRQFAFTDGASAVNGIAATLDGRMIATVGDDGILRIWDGRTGNLMRRVPTGQILFSVSFSPDGSTVYTDGAQGLVQAFDACPLCTNGRALLRASDALAVRPLTAAERQAVGSNT